MAVTIDGSGGLSGVPAIDSDELSVAGAVTVGTTLNNRDSDDCLLVFNNGTNGYLGFSADL